MSLVNQKTRGLKAQLAVYVTPAIVLFGVNASGTETRGQSADTSGTDLDSEMAVISSAGDPRSHADLPHECNDNGVPDDQDIAGGTSSDENGNGLPDECEVRKNRYLTFASAGTGPAVAYRIELTASEFFPDSTGVLGWLGEPGDKNVSRVVGEPLFTDNWPSYVFIGDCEIIPVSLQRPAILSVAIRPALCRAWKGG